MVLGRFADLILAYLLIKTQRGKASIGLSSIFQDGTRWTNLPFPPRSPPRLFSSTSLRCLVEIVDFEGWHKVVGILLQTCKNSLRACGQALSPATLPVKATTLRTAQLKALHDLLSPSINLIPTGTFLNHLILQWHGSIHLRCIIQALATMELICALHIPVVIHPRTKERPIF